MALISCPECKSQISDKAKSCPRCGFPIDDEFIDSEQSKETVEIAANEEEKKDDNDFTDEKVVKLFNNIRKKNIKYLLGSSIRSFLLLFVAVIVIGSIIVNPNDAKDNWLFIVLFGGSVGLFSYFSIKNTAEEFKSVFMPQKSTIIRALQRFGDINTIASWVSDNIREPLFETREIIICKDIVVFKKSYTIMPVIDLISLYKYIHKTNYVVDYIGLTFKDIYARTHLIKWKNANEIDTIVKALIHINPNIRIGYGSDLNIPKIDLPKSKF